MSAALVERESRRTARRAINLTRPLIYLCSLLIVIWSVGPFLWQLSTSLQLDRDLIGDKPWLLPISLCLDHFVNIFVAKTFHRYILNSVIVPGACRLICLFIGAVAAYALAI